jgi:hypothetical protein
VRVEDAFADDEPPVRLQHSSQLAKGGLLVRDLAQDLDQESRVEGAVPLGKRGGVGPRGDDVLGALRSRGSHRVVEPFLDYVDDLELAPRRDPRGDRKRVIAGAGPDLEDAFVRARLEDRTKALPAEARMGPLDEETLTVGKRRGMGPQPGPSRGQED